ncbi:hypothetical protein GQ457_14G020660 [Hibiscus cannabinus]
MFIDEFLVEDIKLFESVFKTTVKPRESIHPTHQRKITTNFIFSDGTILLHSAKQIYNTKFPHLPPVPIIRCKRQI